MEGYAVTKRNEVSRNAMVFCSMSQKVAELCSMSQKVESTCVQMETCS